MRAVVLSAGRLLLDSGRPDPEPPAGEALIRVLLAGICRTDQELARGYMGFSGVPGHEFVGRVERCPSAPEWEGRRVVGEINCACGDCFFCRSRLPGHCARRTVLGIQGRDGCLADLCLLPTGNLVPVPEAISDERAVFAEPLAAACRILDQVALRPGSRALVVGDGKLGILCAWVLAAAGCRVTLLGKHPPKLAAAADFPAERAPETVLLGDWPAQPPPEERYGLVVEASGTAGGLALSAAATRPLGTLVLKSTFAGRDPLNLAPLVVDEITLVGSRCGSLARALEGMERHGYPTAHLISGRYPLERAGEAFAAAGQAASLKVLVEPGAGDRAAKPAGAP